MKSLKKVLALLLAGAMLIPQAAVFAEEVVEEEIKPEAIVIEAEKASVVEGAFGTSTAYGGASGGSVMQIYSTKETASSFTVDFGVDVEGEYDVWVLGSLGTSDYVSQWDYKISDTDEWKDGTGFQGGQVGYGGMHGIPIYWLRLETRDFTPGDYSISVQCNKTRTLATDFMLCHIDNFCIVPSSWQWSPSGTLPPYEKEAMKFEFAGGKIANEVAIPRQNVKITVVNKVAEATPYQAQLYTEIRWKGQKVVGTVHDSAVPMNKWKKGKEYASTVQLQIPFNAPDGVYEVWTGINDIAYISGEEMCKVGEVVVGEVPKRPEPNLLTVSNITLPETVERQVPFSVEVEYTPTTKKRGVKPYLEFYNPENEDELWYVAECDTAVDTIAGAKEKKTFSFTIKDDVPDGEYNVRFGFHWYKNDGDFKKVTISGGEMVRKKTHKPLSFGLFKAETSGNYQLWYVDQKHTLIWNGEPYIPMGGMYVSPYILNPQSEQRYEQEIERLDMFESKGIKHFYLNTNVLIQTAPLWFLEHYFQLLDERGIMYGWQSGTGGRGTEVFGMRAVDHRVVADATGSGRVSADENVSLWWTAGTGGMLEMSNIWVAIDPITGAVVDSGKGETVAVNGSTARHFADLDVPAGNYKVYFNMWAKTTGNQTYVDPFVDREDHLQDYHNFFKNFTSTDNFRTFIDMVYNEWGFHNWSEPLRLTAGDDYYTEWLKEKYSSIEELNEKWGMLDKIDSFEEAAGIVPVYTEKGTDERCISYCVHRLTGESFRTDTRKGILWDDFITFRDWKTGEFQSDVADIASQYENSDVPVVVKHISIIEDYNVNHNTDSGIDGLGGEIYGDKDMSLAKRAYPYSEVEAAAKTQWFILTEGNTEEGSAAKAASDTPQCYNTEEQMHDYFNDHLAQGMKGIYDFLFYWVGGGGIEVWDYQYKPECYDWNTNYLKYIEANIDEIAAYEREDGDPHTWMYPGGQTWWYMPNKRRGALPDDDYVSTRVPQWQGQPVMMTFDPTVDKDMLFVTLENAPATLNWGPQLNEYLADKPEGEKVVQMGLRKDLGALPLIDKYYTNEFMTEGNVTMQVLKPTETSTVLLENGGKPYALKDGDIYIIATTDWCDINGQWGYMNDELLASVGLTYDAAEGKKDEGSAQAPTTVKEVNFKDIDGHWAKANILDLAKKGIIAGRTAETFAPDEQVTRAELLQLMFASVNMQLYKYAGCFSDVVATDWYANVMQTANEAKIIASQLISGTEISPNKPITREETASILSKMCIAAGKVALGDIDTFKDASEVGEWAKADMQNLVAQKIIFGDDNNCLNPGDTLTRAEAAAMITRFMGVYLAK